MNTFTLFALVGLVAASLAMPLDVLPNHQNADCDLCRRIVGVAERHIHGGNITQAALKRELDHECVQFTHTHGQETAKQCAQYVDSHIATIYNDITAGKSPETVCEDVQLCQAGTAPSRAPEEAIEVLPDQDPCQTCSFIVGRAEHHFRRNETVQQLQGRLDRECEQLGHLQGQQAAANCKQVLDSHIQVIYDDIEAGKRPHEICADIGQCAAGPSGAPPSGAPEEDIEVLPDHPHDPCQTCSFIVGRAEHHFRRNETVQQLQAQLDRECDQLGHFQGADAAAHCKQILDSNIQTIYNDIEAGKRPHQICNDIGECAANTTPSAPAEEEELPTHHPNACRICEHIIGQAEHHIHNRNVTDKARLLRELEHECIRIDHQYGDGTTVACINIVQADIDIIYNDISNHARPRQVCVDIGECANVTGSPSPASFLFEDESH